MDEGTQEPNSPNTPEGLTFRPRSEAELSHVIDEAFRYRGDVTLHLNSGERVEGYLFNRNPDVTHPYLQIMLQDQSVPRIIQYAEIHAVSFTGEDTASGKDWEDWVKKKKSERQAEAAAIEAAARARGHL
jgi:hypothetical protein